MSLSEYASDTEHDVPTIKGGDPHPPIPWSEAHENILIEWADKAMCYRWLHTKAHAKYSSANAWFTIPVIIMSTVTGTANFAQDKFPGSIKQYATMGIGAINIFAGILTTVQQFLKIGELNEAHRVSGIAWDKFYRNIKVELAKTPTERIPVLQMLKIAKEEFDRLMETSPAIPEAITVLFQSTFTNGVNISEIAAENLTSKQKAFVALKKPEICDELTSCKQFVYREPHSEKIAKEIKGGKAIARKAIKIQQQQDKVGEVIKQFMNTRKRPPTEDEILEELEDSTVTKNLIQRSLSSLETNIKLDVIDSDPIGPDRV